MIDELMKKIEALTTEECNKGLKEHGTFNSPHEGYAIIKEEVEEAQEDLVEAIDNLNHAWNAIRNDNNFTAGESIYQLKTKALMAASELVQVAAMAQKYGESFREVVSNGNNNRIRYIDSSPDYSHETEEKE